MAKSMDKRKRMIRGAAVFVALAAVSVLVRSIIRKRRPRITYGPMHIRDQQRIDYLNNKIWQCDVTCRNMLRFERAPFFRLCDILRDRKLLENSPHLCVEQQVAMFLHTVGHNLRNRVVATNFGRSFYTISKYYRGVLHAIGELRNEYIRPPSSETPTKIAGNHRFDPYFKDCIGAIDGTHVRASVVKEVEHSFRGRKTFATQNVEHYRAMETIFGSTTATGKYAKSGNDPLSIDLEEDGSGVDLSPNVGESKSKGPPKKKAKVVIIEDDPLVTTLKDGFKMVADALVKSGGDDDALPDGLWDALVAIKGFDEGHVAHYYAHLVDNPKIANAFMTLKLDNKLVWLARYVEKTFGVIYNLK